MKYKNQSIKKLLKTHRAEDNLLAIELMVAKEFPLSVFREYMRMGYPKNQHWGPEQKLYTVNSKYHYLVDEDIISIPKDHYVIRWRINNPDKFDIIYLNLKE